MSKKINCSICHIQIEENYCTRCGQKAAMRNTTTLSLLTDFLSNTLSLEKSGLATVIQVLSNPKFLIDSYYEGFRNYYTGPAKLLIYALAATALYLGFVDYRILGLSLDLEEGDSDYAFWGLLLPFLVLSSYLSFFRIERAFAKHLISVVYVSSAVYIVLLMLNAFLILILGDPLGAVAFVVYLVSFFIWNSRALLPEERSYARLLLYTLVQFFMYILCVLFCFLLMSYFGILELTFDS